MKTCIWNLDKLVPDFNAIENRPIISNISYIQAKDTPDWKFPIHTHNDLEISIILNGKALMYWGGKEYILQKKDIVIKNAGILHSEKSDCDEPVEQICITVDKIDCSSKYPNHILPDGRSPVVRGSDHYQLLSELAKMLVHLCPQIYTKTADESEFHAFYSVFYALIDTVLLTVNNSEPLVEKQKKLKTVNDVIYYIDHHYTQKHSLQGLADKFFISPYYLEHKFKEQTGFAINQYLINLRMGEAEKMLIFENKSIGEIARHCGYSNLQYFYAVFKKFAGCTPVEFRNKYL